ncbi:MAG: hypothetical protein KA354_20345 [Phycisphaerae bacterium]|nr:hypothetical protein [Phycisphaerae bacterium]
MGVALGFMVILAGSSAILAPILLSVLLPVMVGNDSLRVNVFKMTGTLLMTQLIPLLAGLLVR